MGTIRVRYGPRGPVATEDIPLIAGDNVVPFNNPGTGLLSGAVAWTDYQIGNYRVPDSAVGVSLFVWENAAREITVDSLSLMAGDAGVSVVLAVSGER